jgi:voltage-gated potassium channel
MKDSCDDKKNFSFWTLFIFATSIVSLFNQVFIVLIDSDPELKHLLIYLDDTLCIFFLSDFIYKFTTAKNKLKYMRWGWIDLLSSIPAIGWFRWGRLTRIFRIIRVLRAFKNFHELFHALFKNRIKGTFYSVALFAIFLILFAAIIVLMAEEHVDSNIKTAEDAIWWSVVTVTTVGYGDRYPVTTVGRIIGAALMFTGAGLFSVLTAYIAAFFVEHEDHGLKQIKSELREIKELLQK